MSGRRCGQQFFDPLRDGGLQSNIADRESIAKHFEMSVSTQHEATSRNAHDLTAGPIWSLAAIESFGANWSRKPG